MTMQEPEDIMATVNRFEARAYWLGALGGFGFGIFTGIAIVAYVILGA